MSGTATDQSVRSLRPPKPEVDPYKAHGFLVEEERRPGGKMEQSLTVFLAGAECPFTCTFCDLWRWTVDGPTPPGALTTQLQGVLNALVAPMPERLKLYNASNFFDQRAVPPEDLLTIAKLSAPFAAVTVESHANTIGATTLAFARSIPGRLEVAIGLETIHPIARAHLNKRLDLARFDSASRFLAANEIDVRVFVLLGAPHVPAEESVSWTVRTVEYAVERGASVVSIIPVRGGNGELERLQGLGHFTPPTLSQLEETLEQCMRFANSVVSADLWDVGRLPACERCRRERVGRLQQMNATSRAPAPILCADCGPA
ncbi:MAG: archaeosine synthase beta-subunit [Gemmatimonadaceae bacterium]|nr:archaeosine synthase beta-subunit [Gemmatimonadaceae bacterium]